MKTTKLNVRTTKNVDSCEFVPGQVIFDRSTGTIYLDWLEKEPLEQKRIAFLNSTGAQWCLDEDEAETVDPVDIDPEYKPDPEQKQNVEVAVRQTDCFLRMFQELLHCGATGSSKSFEIPNIEG